MGLGLDEQLGANAGLGETVQDRLTGLLKPFCEVTVIVELADCPGLTEPGAGVPALKVKSGVVPVPVRIADV